MVCNACVTHHDEHGAFAGYIGACMDVTDRFATKQITPRVISKSEQTLKKRTISTQGNPQILRRHLICLIHLSFELRALVGK